jgi:aldehyde:ferredoxin oxidoreductase
MMTVPIPDEGVAKGAVVNKAEFELGLDDYYEVRGWTKEGVPKAEKLKELGLEECLNIISKTGEE